MFERGRRSRLLSFIFVVPSKYLLREVLFLHTNKKNPKQSSFFSSLFCVCVCVLPSRVNKKGWSVVRRPKNAFFLVFFFSHKKKGKKKRTIV